MIESTVVRACRLVECPLTATLPVSRPFEVERSQGQESEKLGDRVLTLYETKLNEPLEQSTFTFEQFRFKDGQRIWDRIKEAHYIYKDGKMIPDPRYEWRFED